MIEVVHAHWTLYRLAMPFNTLNDWLVWQETLHPRSIDLGLERLKAMLKRLGFVAPACPVITIAGTKGKGSCAALLESIYRRAGFKTGLFTSPHLLHYNERIRLFGEMASDETICSTFARINAARGDISLTYFEFNALAAFLLFADAQLDVWILEVGMGGRLDAVNVIDADVAVVTSIGLDHTEWLGNDLESIAREKTGIARAHRPLVFGALQMPKAIAETAHRLAAPLYRIGVEFTFELGANGWSWRAHQGMEAALLNDLSLPGIAGDIQLFNASAALCAVQLLQARLPVSLQQTRQGLASAHLHGRFQQCTDLRGVEWVLDVAHNAMSAQVLAQHLAQLPALPTIAILGVMADKDLAGMVSVLRAQVQEWIAVALPGSRALPVNVLAAQLSALGCAVIGQADSVIDACELARRTKHAASAMRILVCGSFLTVGPALQWLEET
jgi:dihydrofolate synthase / folylpolyglutamate synthase